MNPHEAALQNKFSEGFLQHNLLKMKGIYDY